MSKQNDGSALLLRMRRESPHLPASFPVSLPFASRTGPSQLTSKYLRMLIGNDIVLLNHTYVLMTMFADDA